MWSATFCVCGWLLEPLVGEKANLSLVACAPFLAPANGIMIHLLEQASTDQSLSSVRALCPRGKPRGSKLRACTDDGTNRSVVAKPWKQGGTVGAYLWKQGGSKQAKKVEGLWGANSAGERRAAPAPANLNLRVFQGIDCLRHHDGFLLALRSVHQQKRLHLLSPSPGIHAAVPAECGLRGRRQGRNARTSQTRPPPRRVRVIWLKIGASGCRVII